MKSEEVIEILSRYSSIPNDGESFNHIIKAYDEAIKAVEVVDKIKQSFIENKNTHGDYGWEIAFGEFGEAVYDILCEAYGDDKDCESWIKEL